MNNEEERIRRFFLWLIGNYEVSYWIEEIKQPGWMERMPPFKEWSTEGLYRKWLSEIDNSDSNQTVLHEDQDYLRSRQEGSVYKNIRLIDINALSLDIAQEEFNKRFSHVAPRFLFDNYDGGGTVFTKKYQDIFENMVEETAQYLMGFQVSEGDINTLTHDQRQKKGGDYTG